jgi:hypothetical protein
MRGSTRTLTTVAKVIALLLMLALGTAARADAVTLDFETPPPALGTAITDEYLSNFVYFQQSDYGFRPARTSAPGLAHSGTIAADVGADRCPDGGNGGAGCEFVRGGTTVNFTHTASDVSLYAGLFDPLDPAFHIYARLDAYDANHQFIVSGPTLEIHQGFNTQLAVASGANNIASVQLFTSGDDTGESLGFDDLTVTYAGAVPDVSAAAGVTDRVTLLQGDSVDVPISLARINGSNGPLDLSVTGLPAGVTGTLTPNPVPGTQNSATLHLTASGTAPGFFSPVDVTVTATPSPNPNASVAPGPRSTSFPLLVRSPYDLVRTRSGTEAIPECASLDVPLQLQRDQAFSTNKTATLAVTSAPAGVSAQFLPSATVAPGGGFFADVTLRLSRPAGTIIPLFSTVTVQATAPNAPTRTLSIPVSALASTAAIDSTTTSGTVPARFQPGSTVRLTGSGFCPGTTVIVGNARATASTTIEAGNQGLTFVVPRLATTGKIQVVVPGSASYFTSGVYTVRSFRNTNGFQFDNPDWGNLSFDEITDLFGTEEMFLSANPCWPLGDCTIALPIPDPIAYLKWQAIEQVVKGSHGHCFGINRTMQEFRAGRIHVADFQAGATRAFDLGSPNGPNGSLGSYLDQRHAGQTSKEFLLTYGVRNDSITVQLQRARAEIAAGRLPGIVMKNGITEGHVVTVDDIETLADGTTVLHLYDNENPFVPGENSDGTGDTHFNAEKASSIFVNPTKTHWDYDSGSFAGAGNDGSFYTTTLNDWPAGTAPTLPGIVDAAIGVFGSAGGAAVTGPQEKGTEVVPVFDRSAIPGANGFVLGTGGNKTITHTMMGKKTGSYSQTIMGDNFIGGVQGVPTAKGVDDRVSSSIDQHTLDFSGEKTRPLKLNVGLHRGRSSHLATFATHTFKGGGDTAAIGPGSVIYDHDGARTNVTLTLESVESGASAAEFRSAPMSVGSGERLTVAPTSWRSLESVRVTVRRANGTKRVLRLRNRAKGNGARIAIRALGLKTLRGRRSATLTARLSRVPAKSAQGVVLRLARGKRVVAHKVFGVGRARNGTRTFTWRLPKLANGAYRLIGDVTVAATGAHPGTGRKTKRVSVHIG